MKIDNWTELYLKLGFGLSEFIEGTFDFQIKDLNESFLKIIFTFYEILKKI